MNQENFEQFNSRDVKFMALKEKFKVWIHKDPIKNYEKAAKFAERIREEYPDHADFKMYHVLGGSGVSHKCAMLDFPGDDSVEKFIEERYNSLENN